MAYKIDPISQFEVERIFPLRLGSVDVSFTNTAFAMLLAVILAGVFFAAAMRPRALVPGRLQSIAEVSYHFIEGMLRDTIGHGSRPFLPFIFTLFFFVLFCNMLGLLPYELPVGSFHKFTATGQIIVTFTMAIFVISLVIVVGLVKHGFRFFTLFVPKGVPVAILPLICVIEVISFLIRPITLSVRLCANMLAGHTMLEVFAGFVVMLALSGGIATAGVIFPFTFAVAITALEFLVAFLQAYVFAVLTCIYLKDAIHLHDH